MLSGSEMSVEVVMGESEEGPEFDDLEFAHQDPDEFFAKNAFRIVYQTNQLC